MTSRPVGPPPPPSNSMSYARRLHRYKTVLENRKDPVKSVIQNALDQMCHGRVSFGLKQLTALIGLEDDPDYQGMIADVRRRLS